MADRRLELALEELGPGDWEVFEKFAAEFLVIRFPELRTTASRHGDGGRDGQVYVLGEEPRTALQYSVTASWNAKIHGTVKRLEETLPTVRELVYATNQLIGPDSDDLKAELWRDKGITLDICDRTWFTDRQATAPQRVQASEELIALKVKPLLVERRIEVEGGTRLIPTESRIALLHLSLDASDMATHKGLTKSCFESLTLSALHGTMVDSTLTLEEVTARVLESLPAGHDQQVAALVASALKRLAKKGGPVHRLGSRDAYHLSYSEHTRLERQTSKFLLDERELESQLLTALEERCGQNVQPDSRDEVGRALRVSLESILLRKGELFASAANSGNIEPINADEILHAIKATEIPAGATPAQVAAAATAVLEEPTDSVHAHLRRLADAYTLFAFLRQTPDVQKVVVKIFSDGMIWLDTSVILPLFAETLIDEPDKRPFSLIVRAAREAGIRFFVTDGVVEEVERHLNRCILFSTMETSKWRGRVPYVYAAYSDSGRPRSGFRSWVEEFRGESRPEDDVREYLEQALSIERRNLAELSDRADPTLRRTVQELWAGAHDRRRGSWNSDWDPGTVSRLVAHDVENSVGVLEMRKRDSASGLGYRHWWLTLDRAAFRLRRALKEEFGKDAPMSPALSPDYLVQILRIGPMRTAVETERRVNLPLLVDFSRLDVTPRELVETADELRSSMDGTSEHVITRRVRDRMDSMRATYATEAFERVVADQDAETGELLLPGLADRS